MIQETCKLPVVTHACNPSTGGIKTRLEVQGQSSPHSEFKTRLDCVRPCLKTIIATKAKDLHDQSFRSEHYLGNLSCSLFFFFLLNDSVKIKVAGPKI